MHPNTGRDSLYICWMSHYTTKVGSAHLECGAGKVGWGLWPPVCSIPGFRAGLCNWGAVWPWADHFTSLGLSPLWEEAPQRYITQKKRQLPKQDVLSPLRAAWLYFIDLCSPYIPRGCDWVSLSLSSNILVGSSAKSKCRYIYFKRLNMTWEGLKYKLFFQQSSLSTCHGVLAYYFMSC